jgi:hypothetical protein
VTAPVSAAHAVLVIVVVLPVSHFIQSLSLRGDAALPTAIAFRKSSAEHKGISTAVPAALMSHAFFAQELCSYVLESGNQFRALRGFPSLALRAAACAARDNR